MLQIIKISWSSLLSIHSTLQPSSFISRSVTFCRSPGLLRLPNNVSRRRTHPRRADWWSRPRTIRDHQWYQVRSNVLCVCSETCFCMFLQLRNVLTTRVKIKLLAKNNMSIHFHVLWFPVFLHRNFEVLAVVKAMRQFTSAPWPQPHNSDTKSWSQQVYWTLQSEWAEFAEFAKASKLF